MTFYRAERRPSGRGRVRSREGGMTLVEIIVVLVLLGTIIPWLINNLFGKAEGAKARINDAKMSQVVGFIQTYQLQFNKLPQTLGDLSGCGDAQGSCVPVAKGGDLKDAWDRDFVYTTDGRTFTLKSLGSDGREGGTEAAGDVVKTGP